MIGASVWSPPHGHWMIVRIYLAFFFAFFGLGVMFGRDQTSALVGAPFAALGITFLWRLWIAIPSRYPHTLEDSLYAVIQLYQNISGSRASLLTQPMQSAQWVARRQDGA